VVDSAAKPDQGSVEAGVRTFLLADVRGYTRFTMEEGDHAAARLATALAEICRDAVGAHGGEVVELRGDEALAVFTSTREALRAAADLQGRFATETRRNPGLPLRVGIGLDAGEAVPVEGGYRGAALNLAARLCSLAAAGEILASETVTNLARRVESLEFADRGAVSLKGFDQPIRVHEVRPAIEASAPVAADQATAESAAGARLAGAQTLPIGGFLGALPSGAIVGRETELGRVVALIDAVEGGAGRLAALVGEPGIGKTRLAQEATLVARNRGFLIAAGSCYEAHRTTSFYPFLDLMAGLFALAPEHLRARASEQFPYLGAFLPNRNLPIPASDGSGAEQERLFWSVTGFVQAMAAIGPLLLLLDDLHWADASSLQLLQHVARHTRANPVLILATYRDVEVDRQHPLEPALRELGRQDLLDRVSVRRLPSEQTAALAAADLDIERVSDEFATLLYERTEGNPFFVQQVLRDLVERGDVFREAGEWKRGKALSELEVPESIRSAVGQRLSRLTEATQDSLRAASVLGQTFRFEELLAMEERDEPELERDLEQALAAGLIRELDRGDSYAFDHALTQQTLYAELTARRRRRLHLAAAEALVALPESKIRPRMAELAWHYLQGDDPEKALGPTLAAGDAAARSYAHAEAELQYRTALELARELEDRAHEAETLERLGRVLVGAARYDEALPLLEEAALAAEALGDSELRLRTETQIGFAHNRGGSRAAGLERLERFEASLRDASPSSALADFYVSLSQLHSIEGQQVAQLADGERATQIARSIGDRRALVSALNALAGGLGNTGRQDEVRAVYAELLPLAEAEGDPWLLWRTRRNVANLAGEEGRVDEEVSWLRSAIAAVERLNDTSLLCEAIRELGWSYRFRDNWPEGRRLLEQARDLAIANSVPAQQGWAAYDLGFLALDEDDLDSALETAREAEGIARQVDDTSLLWQAQWLIARVFLERGLPEEALAAHEPARAAIGARQWVIVGDLADTNLEAGRLKEAKELSELALGNEEHWILRVYLSFIRGKVLARLGLWEEGRRLLEGWVEFTRKPKSYYWEAVGLYELGEACLLAGERDAAREYLEAARELSVRIGARRYERRARGALEQLAEPEEM
jgi:class 3 adenylate cyclase